MILIGGILSLFSNGRWLMIFTSLAYMLNQLHQYQKINIFFKDEGDFLMNYGKAFFQWLAQHEKDIETLERAKLQLHTTIIQMGL